MITALVDCARCPRLVTTAQAWFYPATGERLCPGCHAAAHARHVALTTAVSPEVTPMPRTNLTTPERGVRSPAGWSR